MNLEHDLRAMGAALLCLSAFAATPAAAVVYCKTVGAPRGCVARPAPVVVAPRPVVVAPPVRVVAPPARVVAPPARVVAPRPVGPAYRAPAGTPTNRGGPSIASAGSDAVSFRWGFPFRGNAPAGPG